MALSVSPGRPKDVPAAAGDIFVVYEIEPTKGETDAWDYWYMD